MSQGERPIGKSSSHYSLQSRGVHVVRHSLEVATAWEMYGQTSLPLAPVGAGLGGHQQIACTGVITEEVVLKRYTKDGNMESGDLRDCRALRNHQRDMGPWVWPHGSGKF